MTDLSLVTYCGLYCGLCAERARIPNQAQALRGSMHKEGYEYWGKELPGFTEFWSFLSGICEPDNACPGCRQDGGRRFAGSGSAPESGKSTSAPFVTTTRAAG